MPSSDTHDDTDTRTDHVFAAFTPITEHPLPLTQSAVDDLAASHPQLPDDISVDALHDEYVNTVARNNEWSVFTVDLYGYESDVYVWNHQLGDGFRVPRDEWMFGSLAEVIGIARDTDTGWDRTEPAATPDDGCPYCGGDLTASMQPSGTYTQRCTDCGRSRTIG